MQPIHILAPSSDSSHSASTSASTSTAQALTPTATRNTMSMSSGMTSIGNGTTASATLVQLPSMTASLAMEDALGIVYVIENPQQFWSELEDIAIIPRDYAPTLEFLDSTLKRFVSLCAVYHEQYLHTPLQVEHACNLLLDSELFAFHSERMCENLVHDAQDTTDPHVQLITYTVLLYFGRRRPEFFRSQKRWNPLLPLLMDHLLVDIDSLDTTSAPASSSSFSYGAGGLGGGSVPVEVRLRLLAVKLLYEVCRLHKFDIKDLRIFDDAFIDYLFDLVEQTRNMQDESLNYSVVKLIVALNEQFMVASLNLNHTQTNDQGHHHHHPPNDRNKDELTKNRVLLVLMRRLGSSRTFGENMIFMLNRAQRTPEDLCMQLLVLKILYLLFTTKGTEEFFYTNDLCVLVDVFLRELADLDEESESLRHTYLRVLHPLLTKTQLRSVPYKRQQIVYALESLTANSRIREISPTMQRLVERCLSAEWCAGLKSTTVKKADQEEGPPAEDWQAEPREDENIQTLSRERSISTADGRASRKKNHHYPHVVSASNSTSELQAPSVSAPTGGGKTLKGAKSMEFRPRRGSNAHTTTTGSSAKDGSVSHAIPHTSAGRHRRSPPPPPTPPLPTSMPSSPRRTPTTPSFSIPSALARGHNHHLVQRRESNASVMSQGSVSAASMTGVALASTGAGAGSQVLSASPTSLTFATAGAGVDTGINRRKGSLNSDPASGYVYHAHPNPNPPKSDSGVMINHHNHHHQHHRRAPPPRPDRAPHHASNSLDSSSSSSSTYGTGSASAQPVLAIPVPISSSISAQASASSPDLTRVSSEGSNSGGVGIVMKHRRMPPPVPPNALKRRKPPAVPIRTINVDAPPRNGGV